MDVNVTAAEDTEDVGSVLDLYTYLMDNHRDRR
jgi:hypothetical protein